MSRLRPRTVKLREAGNPIYAPLVKRGRFWCCMANIRILIFANNRRARWTICSQA